MESKHPKALLRRLHVANYRSVRALTVEFDPELTVLVGPNAAGKSNIVDALQFLSDCAGDIGLRGAIAKRGGIKQLQHRYGSGRPRGIVLAVEIVGSAPLSGEPPPVVRYGFSLQGTSEGGWLVTKEWMAIGEATVLDRNRTSIEAFGTPVPSDRVADDTLFGPRALALYERTGLVTGMFFSRLEQIATYSIVPEMMRPPQPQSPDPLSRTGDNFYSVWERLARKHKKIATRVVALASQIVSGLQALEPTVVGNYLTATARIRGPQAHGVLIHGASLSDGTLRVLALLTAAYQPGTRLVSCIEEPEVAVHPYAAGLLMEALISSPRLGQLVITSHSPEIIGLSLVNPSMIRVVRFVDGASQVGGIAPEQAQLIREHLVTQAELLTEGNLKMALIPERVDSLGLQDH